MQGLGDTSTKLGKFFFGYKVLVSLNAENHLITSLMVTPGNAFEGHYLQELIEKTEGRVC